MYVHTEVGFRVEVSHNNRGAYFSPREYLPFVIEYSGVKGIEDRADTGADVTTYAATPEAVLEDIREMGNREHREHSEYWLTEAQQEQLLLLLRRGLERSDLWVDLRYREPLYGPGMLPGRTMIVNAPGWRWWAQHPDSVAVYHDYSGDYQGRSKIALTGPCKWLDFDLTHDPNNEDDKCFYECQCGPSTSDPAVSIELW